MLICLAVRAHIAFRSSGDPRARSTMVCVRWRGLSNRLTHVPTPFWYSWSSVTFSASRVGDDGDIVGGMGWVGGSALPNGVEVLLNTSQVEAGKGAPWSIVCVSEDEEFQFEGIMNSDGWHSSSSL